MLDLLPPVFRSDSPAPRPGQRREPVDRASPHAGLLGRQYIVMANAFAPNGGIAGGDELAGLLRPCRGQPISLLARWIVDRAVVHFEWRTTIMLPMFQFEPPSMTVRPPVADVLRELSGAFDDWELALWFAQPNAWLDDRRPVDVLRIDPGAVVDSARADRYVALG